MNKNFVFKLQTFATTYTTAPETQTTATEVSTDTTTILIFDGQKVVTEEVFEYGLEKMRAYNNKRFLPKAGIALMQKSDVDKMFDKWDAEDLAEMVTGGAGDSDTGTSGEDNP